MVRRLNLQYLKCKCRNEHEKSWYENSSESCCWVLKNAVWDREWGSLSIVLYCVWFHAPWDIPNQPDYVLLDYVNVTNFLLPYCVKHTHKTNKHMHTHTYTYSMKDRCTWCGLLGAAPTQKKGTVIEHYRALCVLPQVWVLISKCFHRFSYRVQ